MLLMKVEVFSVVRGVSITYAMTVGKDEASEDSRMEPEADQTKTSIWPGVSTMMCSVVGAATGSSFCSVVFSSSLLGC